MVGCKAIIKKNRFRCQEVEKRLISRKFGWLQGDGRRLRGTGIV